MEVCGDIDSEVIGANPELAKLAKILGDRDIEKHRKMIAAKKTEINKELEKLPVRIDEASKGLPDVAGLEMDKLKNDIEALRVRSRRNLQNYRGFQAGGEIAEKAETASGTGRGEVLGSKKISKRKKKA